MMIRFRRLALACFTTLVWGCSDDSGGADEGMGGSMMAGGGAGGGAGAGAGGEDMQPDPVSFADDIHPILLQKCGGSDCHSVGNAVAPAHANEDVDVAYQATQGMTARGVVHERMVARTAGDDTFGSMPPNYAEPPCDGPPGSSEGCLTEAEFALLMSWSEQGAPP